MAKKKKKKIVILDILCIHSVRWGVTATPPKNTTPFFAKPLLKSANCPSPSFLGNPPLYIDFSRTNPPKTWIFL